MSPIVSPDLEDELSPEMTGLAEAMSVGHLGQAIELDLGRPHRTCLIQLDDPFERPAGAPNGRSQRRHIRTWWLRRLRTRSDEGGAAAGVEDRVGSLRHIAADRVEDSIAIGDSLREVAGIVVDDVVGT